MLSEDHACARKSWWARRDLNPQPRDYESPALTVELQARRAYILLPCNKLQQLQPTALAAALRRCRFWYRLGSADLI